MTSIDYVTGLKVVTQLTAIAETLEAILTELQKLNEPKADHQVMVNNLVTQQGLPRG